MGLSTWLKERRLERVHQKLKRLRKAQSTLRDRESEIERKSKDAPAPDLEAKKLKIHEERERITKTVHELQHEEEKLKAELRS